MPIETVIAVKAKALLCKELIAVLPKGRGFKVGDIVSYRVGGSLEGMPFVGVLTAVGDDYVEIKNGEDVNSTERAMRGTREDRPFVTEEEALREETVG